MSNLNTRVLDPPTHSHQFDVNCGKIRYVSDPQPKTNRPSFCLILKLSGALDGLFRMLSRLHGCKHKCACCLVFFLAWNPLAIYCQNRCCDDYFPCFGKYIFLELQTCSAYCAEGCSSSNIPSNF